MSESFVCTMQQNPYSSYPCILLICRTSDKLRTFFVSHLTMSLEESRRSQRPYRYGMVLLCVGALINWLGLAENYVEPVRYVGVACIIAGALLICAAMCCWLHAPPSRATMHTQHTNHPITAQKKTRFSHESRLRISLWNDRIVLIRD
ncbi:hypothetical protein WN51_14006 [Melipona quadrifasciata]|uniref:Uncharacterized protein n=1 Tax=Melipona quadrifasciata TaxID=166423 RepID=A0A0N0U540_9HYME|nr:hypothetical protein WN51_14006 [Melipona quadrifasciata]